MKYLLVLTCLFQIQLPYSNQQQIFYKQGFPENQRSLESIEGRDYNTTFASEYGPSQGIITPLYIPQEYLTNDLEGASCYLKGGIHCLDETLMVSKCCNYQSSPNSYSLQQTCMQGYKYCTNFLQKKQYMVLTVQQSKCSSKGLPKIIQLQGFYQNQQANFVWNSNSAGAYNCKVQITAVDGLKGKINVQIGNLSGTNVQIYGFPKNINPGYINTGILENGVLFNQVQSSSWTFPSDWMVWIIYNKQPISGYLYINSWVDPLSSQSIIKMINQWQSPALNLSSLSSTQRQMQLSFADSMGNNINQYYNLSSNTALDQWNIYAKIINKFMVDLLVKNKVTIQEVYAAINKILSYTEIQLQQNSQLQGEYVFSALNTIIYKVLGIQSLDVYNWIPNNDCKEWTIQQLSRWAQSWGQSFAQYYFDNQQSYSQPDTFVSTPLNDYQNSLYTEPGQTNQQWVQFLSAWNNFLIDQSIIQANYTAKNTQNFIDAFYIFDQAQDSISSSDCDQLIKAQLLISLKLQPMNQYNQAFFYSIPQSVSSWMKDQIIEWSTSWAPAIIQTQKFVPNNPAQYTFPKYLISIKAPTIQNENSISINQNKKQLISPSCAAPQSVCQCNGEFIAQVPLQLYFNNLNLTSANPSIICNGGYSFKRKIWDRKSKPVADSGYRFVYIDEMQNQVFADKVLAYLDKQGASWLINGFVTGIQANNLLVTDCGATISTNYGNFLEVQDCLPYLGLSRNPPYNITKKPIKYDLQINLTLDIVEDNSINITQIQFRNNTQIINQIGIPKSVQNCGGEFIGSVLLPQTFQMIKFISSCKSEPLFMTQAFDTKSIPKPAKGFRFVYQDELSNSNFSKKVHDAIGTWEVVWLVNGWADGQGQRNSQEIDCGKRIQNIRNILLVQDCLAYQGNLFKPVQLQNQSKTPFVQNSPDQSNPLQERNLINVPRSVFNCSGEYINQFNLNQNFVNLKNVSTCPSTYTFKFFNFDAKNISIPIQDYRFVYYDEIISPDFSAQIRQTMGQWGFVWLVNGWANSLGYGNQQGMDCGKRTDYFQGSFLLVSQCLAYQGPYAQIDTIKLNASSNQIVQTYIKPISITNCSGEYIAQVKLNKNYKLLKSNQIANICQNSYQFYLQQWNGQTNLEPIKGFRFLYADELRNATIAQGAHAALDQWGYAWVVNGWIDGSGYGNERVMDCGAKKDPYIGQILMVQDCLPYTGLFTTEQLNQQTYITPNIPQIKIPFSVTNCSGEYIAGVKINDNYKNMKSVSSCPNNYTFVSQFWSIDSPPMPLSGFRFVYVDELKNQTFSNKAHQAIGYWNINWVINGWADGQGYGNNQLIDCGKREDQYEIGSFLMVSDCLEYIGQYSLQDAPVNSKNLTTQISIIKNNELWYKQPLSAINCSGEFISKYALNNYFISLANQTTCESTYSFKVLDWNPNSGTSTFKPSNGFRFVYADELQNSTFTNKLISQINKWSQNFVINGWIQGKGFGAAKSIDCGWRADFQGIVQVSSCYAYVGASQKFTVSTGKVLQQALLQKPIDSSSINNVPKDQSSYNPSSSLYFDKNDQQYGISKQVPEPPASTKLPSFDQSFQGQDDNYNYYFNP